GEYVGGYADWLRQRPAAGAQAAAADAAASPSTPPVAATPPRRKLGFKQARELEQLPARIEQLETEIASRTAAMAQPASFQQEGGAITAANLALAQLQTELEAAYARWEELEAD